MVPGGGPGRGGDSSEPRGAERVGGGAGAQPGDPLVGPGRGGVLSWAGPLPLLLPYSFGVGWGGLRKTGLGSPNENQTQPPAFMYGDEKSVPIFLCHRSAVASLNLVHLLESHFSLTITFCPPAPHCLQR